MAMRAAVVHAPGGDYRMEERAVPEPPAGHVRVKVHACGYCRSDENIRRGHAGADFPRVPGHEVAGTIDAVGLDVPEYHRGDRVGIGWHGGHCMRCATCRAGDFKRCPGRLGCGTSYDGGFATHLVAPWTALARIPAGLAFEHAGPLQCGGITVWNALRHSGASWGDRVAVQGIGGLGHMAVQFAAAMGFETVAVSRGEDKAKLSEELGAEHFVDAAQGDVGRQLRALGGMRAVVATAPSGQSMRALFDGLGPDGRVVVVGVSGDEVGAPAAAYLGNDRGIQGSVIGTPAEAEHMMRFAALKGVRPMVETFALKDIATAQARLLANKLRFRAVLLPA